MTRCHASNALRNASVPLRFASLTASNSCNASISYGSHIREVEAWGNEATKPHMRIQHPQAENMRYSVTTRPPRKNKRFTSVRSNALERYRATRRPA